MSTDQALADEIEPSSTEYSVVWVAYALQATGALGFVLGPLAAVIIAYARRNAAPAGYLATHYRWLIRTFWWTAAGYLVCLAVIVGAVWPIVGDLVREAIRSGGQAHAFSLDIGWDSIFATVGAAALGALGIIGVWIWNVYRILRGAFLLGDGRAAP